MLQRQIEQLTSHNYSAVDIQTTTFAATGPQCVARLLHSDANLLLDVDPYINHPQITEYTHYLDPWGQALGREVGNVCLYGKTGLAESETKKQCEKSWGYPGILLWFNEGADILGWKWVSVLFLSLPSLLVRVAPFQN